jgi:hypothetical protein
MVHLHVKLSPGKKAAFNNKGCLGYLRKELVKCYIWIIALYGAETWTVWKIL